MKSKEIDWSQSCWREMLIYQRKSMWREDTLRMIISWIGFEPGQTVVDVGCGLGYLGYTFWKNFGENGKYIGFDCNQKLLEAARDMADDWREGGEVEFIEGNAYSLPIADNSADLAMCQTLMMHLERPIDALSEMKRIVKPGGYVVCFEPDNLSAEMAVPHWSLPEPDIQDILLSRKVHYLGNKGRIKLGRGDHGIAMKIPRMMYHLGLNAIDIRMNDKVHFLQPPYDSQMQRDVVERLRKQFFNDERYNTVIEQERETFIAGGGTEEEHARARAIGKKYREIMRDQLDRGTYYACAPGALYAIKGKK